MPDVDDLLSGGATVQQAQYRKEHAVEVFEDASFTLHAWHSNVPLLEIGIDSKDSDMTFAKLQQPGELKDSLLGLGWDKKKDVLSVNFPTEEVRPTKRGVFSKLAKVFNPLGLVLPATLEGKVIYRDVSNELNKPDTPSLGGHYLRDGRNWSSPCRWKCQRQGHSQATKSPCKILICTALVTVAHW